MTTAAQVAAAIALVITPAKSKHPETYQREADNYARIVVDMAARNDLPPLVLVALVTKESDWRPRAINDKTGAVGLGQLNVLDIDGKVSALGREILAGGFEAHLDQLTDPGTNLFLSARWLRRKLDQCAGAKVPMLCALRRYGGGKTSGRAREILELADRLERETAAVAEAKEAR